MGFETLKNIIEQNKENEAIHSVDEDLENDMCPYDAWPLNINSKGQKSCPICGRVWSGSQV